MGSKPFLDLQAGSPIATISDIQLWVDGVKEYTVSGSQTLNTSVTLAASSHRFAILAINPTGQKWESAVNATVK
jgi:hypothetical protein